jgi:soluble lytic murein transglycosylase-like protein
MQMMPATAEILGVADSMDPKQNVNGGVRLQRSLLNSYDGNVSLALAAYNAGPGAVAKYNGIPPYQETQTYVQRVLAAYRS